MLSRLFIFVLFASSAFHSARAQVDFTPTVREYTVERSVQRDLTLKADKGTVTLTPPTKWEVRGEKDRLRMNPPDKNFIELSIQSLAPSIPLTFDDANLALLEQQALKEVPPAAQSVQVFSRAPNTIVMGSNLSFEFVITYQALGQVFQKSVIFINGPTPLLVRFTAPKADYGKFDADFRQTLFTWQWIARPADATTPALASK